MDSQPGDNLAPPPHTWNVTAEGRVQGVGYRYHVLKWARELGVAGWVRNEPGGNVRAVLQHADPAVLVELTHLMRTGVYRAFVLNLDITPLDQAAAQRYTAFEIRR
jgi:acylphosphatase